MPTLKTPLEPRFCERCGDPIPMDRPPSVYYKRRFCGRKCASRTTGENTTNIRPRSKTLVEICFCAHCGWIIPRKEARPAAYTRYQYCSRTCLNAVLSVNNRKKDAQGYSTLHKRVYRARGKASTYTCEYCGSSASDWAHLHDQDGKDPQDYIPLCRPCHVAYDNIAARSIETRRANGTLRLTEEQREKCRIRMQERIERETTEQRSERMKRAWATRRAKQKGNADASIVG